MIKNQTQRKIIAINKVALVLLVFALLISVGLYWRNWLVVNKSLPRIEGDLVSNTIKKQITIRRDHAGIPTIASKTYKESILGLGIAHAQDRFFQMDILRRMGSGSLSSLLGVTTVDEDKKSMQFGLLAQANEAYLGLSEAQKELLSYYSEGVNLGLQSFETAPYEYSLLKDTPKKWEDKDTLLAIYGLYLLVEDKQHERALIDKKLSLSLPAELYRFLVPDGSFHKNQSQKYHIPNSNEWNVRKFNKGHAHSDVLINQYAAKPLSNVWVLSSEKVRGGRPMLAVDINMPLTIPNLWYRASATISNLRSSTDIQGLTLPGIPFFLLGTNENIVWGMAMPASSRNNLSSINKSLSSVKTVEHSFGVKGSSSVTFTSQMASEGPVLEENGESYAWNLGALAMEPANLNLFDLPFASSAEEAMRIVSSSQFVEFDFFIADDKDNIGWVSVGADSQPEGINQKIYNPRSKVILQQDVRKANSEDNVNLLTPRQRQIQDNLRVLFQPDQYTIFNTLVDERNYSLQRWQQLLLNVLDDNERFYPALYDKYFDLIDSWNGSVANEQPSYVIIRAYRDNLARKIYANILAPIDQDISVDEYFAVTDLWTIPLWKIIDDKPLHLLHSSYRDWDAFLIASLFDLDELIDKQYGGLANLSWEAVNEIEFQTLAEFDNIFLKSLIALPEYETKGDVFLPKVREKGFGANARLVLSPGSNQQNLIAMPVGQSSNPLSSYWSVGHEEWAKDIPLMLSPGDTKYELTIFPTEDSAYQSSSTSEVSDLAGR